MSKEDSETYFYTCEECNLSFDDYDEHIRVHHADAEVILKPLEEDENVDDEEMEIEFLDDAVQKLECVECSLTFSTQKKYDKHNETMHGSNTTEDFVVFAYDPATKKCQKLTFSLESSDTEPPMLLPAHQQYYNAFSVEPPEPEVIERQRDTRIPFKRETNDPEGLVEGMVTCHLCDSVFRHFGALKMHMKAHKDKKVRSIEDVLPEGVTLRSDPEIERYYCELCDRSLDMTFKELHIASHGEQGVFCKVCNRRFDTQENLDSHMRALADHAAVNFGRKFDIDPELMKLRPYECGTCGKRFHRPHEKVKHERIHDGTRPYNCEICLKKFRTNTSLVIHLRNHTDLRPFKCTVCDKRFNTSSNCTAHIATHYDERNYQCKECPKAFKTSKGLSNHKLRHFNIYPHQCPKCPRKFQHQKSVAKHLLNHDSKNKMFCPVCEAVFSRKDFLQIHLEKEHKSDIE